MIKNSQSKSYKDFNLNFNSSNMNEGNNSPTTNLKEYNTVKSSKNLNISQTHSNLIKFIDNNVKNISRKHQPSISALTTLKPININNIFQASEQPKRPKILNKIKNPHNNNKFSQDFRVGKVLGKGRFGNVCLARNILTNSLYAVKKISIQKMSKKLLDRIIAQIKIQYFLKHENCLQLYKFYKENNEFILILQAGQGSLFDQLRSLRYLTEHDTAYYIRQTIEALRYLHFNGIIHRDIKPENIILVNNVVKLADFGWSIYTGNKNKRTTFCGTLDYVSPEIILGSQYDQMVDVWSVGVLCYELCTGHAPFQSNRSRQQTYRKIVNVDLKFPKHLSNFIQDFISRLLMRDPKLRMSLQEALEHPFMKKYEEKNIESVQGSLRKLDFYKNCQ